MKDARTVAMRAVCLGALDFRSRWETEWQRTKPGLLSSREQRESNREAANLAQGVTDWVSESGASEGLTAWEATLFEKPVGGWSVADLRATSYVTMVGTLLFALGLSEAIPAYDAEFDPDILRVLPFLSDSPFVSGPDQPPQAELEAMLNAVQLRKNEEVDAARDNAERWLWRARSERLARGGQLERATLHGVLQEGVLRGQIDAATGDLTAFGRQFEALKASELDKVESSASGRLHALNWICDFGEHWEDVPLST